MDVGRAISGYPMCTGEHNISRGRESVDEPAMAVGLRESPVEYVHRLAPALAPREVPASLADLVDVLPHQAPEEVEEPRVLPDPREGPLPDVVLG